MKGCVREVGDPGAVVRLVVLAVEHVRVLPHKVGDRLDMPTQRSQRCRVLPEV